IVQGPKIESIEIGLVFMAMAGCVNGIVGLILVRAGRRAGSVTLVADGKHLISDAVTSVVVIAALVLVKLTGWSLGDPLGAFAVAAYLGYLGLTLLSESAAGLMDRQDVRDEKLLRNILDSHLAPAGKEPQICSYHKLRHRHGGRYDWVDF